MIMIKKKSSSSYNELYCLIRSKWCPFSAEESRVWYRRSFYQLFSRKSHTFHTILFRWAFERRRLHDILVKGVYWLHTYYYVYTVVPECRSLVLQRTKLCSRRNFVLYTIRPISVNENGHPCFTSESKLRQSMLFMVFWFPYQAWNCDGPLRTLHAHLACADLVTERSSRIP